MKTLRGDEHDLGSVHHLHRAQARGVVEDFSCDSQGRTGNYRSESECTGSEGLGIGAFADEPLAAGEDVGERLEQALQLRGGGGGQHINRDGPSGELDLDGAGGLRDPLTLHGGSVPSPLFDRGEDGEATRSRQLCPVTVFFFFLPSIFIQKIITSAFY
jgi:hypothetical protein